MLNQKNRISNQRLIDKLNSEGSVYRTFHFVFRYLPSHSEGSRFAAVVSKKIAPGAVTRNRLRRQINEALRTNLNALKSPIVCLVILKKGSPESLEFGPIETEIKDFFNHALADV